MKNFSTAPAQKVHPDELDNQRKGKVETEAEEKQVQKARGPQGP